MRDEEYCRITKRCTNSRNYLLGRVGHTKHAVWLSRDSQDVSMKREISKRTLFDGILEEHWGSPALIRTFMFVFCILDQRRRTGK